MKDMKEEGMKKMIVEMMKKQIEREQTWNWTIQVHEVMMVVGSFVLIGVVTLIIFNTFIHNNNIHQHQQVVQHQ